MKQRKINEVFPDELTWKRLKCVNGDCAECFYFDTTIKLSIDIGDGGGDVSRCWVWNGNQVISIENDEPLTTK